MTNANASGAASAASGTPIRVVFLLFYYEAWDSLAGVYETMRSDSRFEPTIVSMPRKLTGDDGYGGEADVHAFLNEQRLAHLRLRSADHKENLAKLKSLEPDYVFLNYPWQRNYPPEFRPDVLATFTRIAYVPYFLLPLVDEEHDSSGSPQTAIASHLFEQRTHQLATLVFTQDEATRKAFASTSRGNAHVHVTGNPKLDALKAQATTAKAKRESKRLVKGGDAGSKASKYTAKVLWAPHHSYSPAWLGFGRFAADYLDMLRLAREHSTVKFTLRPHPFLFGTLIDRGVLTAPQLDEWLAEWKSLPNTRINASASFAKQFVANDVLLTDGISFLAEYPLLTAKPAVFIENPQHWEFNAVGQAAVKCNLRVSSVLEFERLLRDCLTPGDLLSSQSQETSISIRNAIEQLHEIADPSQGQSSRLIAEAVAADFAAGHAPVNPLAITEVPWEDRPGREPRID